jgi:RecA/RadA recombinase
MFERRITILVGHFGSGKTEIAVNGAVHVAAGGLPVALVDIDVVKPYFRTREARDLLSDLGVEVVAPSGENATADLPIVLPQVRTLCRDTSRKVIVDAGGDDTGARVLGSLSDVLAGQDLDLLLVLNFRRPFTPDVPSAVAMARGIEAAARRKVTGIVSNTHLMAETTADVVRDGLRMAREAADALGVDLRAVAVEEGLDRQIAASGPGCEVFPLRRIVQPPLGTTRLVVPRSGPLFVLR